MSESRLSMNLPDREKANLDERAARDGVSTTIRVRKALRLLDWWDDQPEGTRILVQRPGEEPVGVVLL